MTTYYTPAVIISQLYLAGTITGEEADMLEEGLVGEIIPRTYKDVIRQFSGIVGRKLTPPSDKI